MIVAAIAVMVYFAKQEKCDVCCRALWDKAVGDRLGRKRARDSEKRRERMNSKYVTSTANPHLDVAPTAQSSPELSVEMTAMVRSEGGVMKTDSERTPLRHKRMSTKLPKDWEKHRDEMGRRYYSNQRTNESQWEAPEGATGGSTGE